MIEHVETPNPLNPLGVKGAGEGGTIPAPAAIIAAIEDALSPFGVRFADMPLTPERIVEALREAGAYEKLACGMSKRQASRNGLPRRASVIAPYRAQKDGASWH